MAAKTEKEEFEETCSVFINTINNYFTQLTSTSSHSGVPYLKEQTDTLLKDYTGMIGISGSRKGFLYISGQKELYASLIESFIGLDIPSEADIQDMAGELSNVVAGNLRQTYGNDFMISVPIVFEGKPKKIAFPRDIAAYVIPITWKGHDANVVIGLE